MPGCVGGYATAPEKCANTRLSAAYAGSEEHLRHVGEDAVNQDTLMATLGDASHRSDEGLAPALERRARELRATRHGKRPLTAPDLKTVPLSDDGLPLVSVQSPEVSFGDLVLSKENEEILLEVVAEHRMKSLLASRGLTPRRRLLLSGPSGTGKTRTAEALAHALGIPLVRVKLSSVVSSYLGQTARHVERILDFAGKGEWVLSFDEIDMLASDRSGSDNDEIRRVVTVLLQELEQYAADNLVVATTNHGDLLDDALWRRFDEILAFKYPNQEQISTLLKLKLRRVKLRVNREQAARSLTGMSHAQIEAVCLDAMRRLVLSHGDSLTTGDLVASAQARRKRLRDVGQGAE
ncbi:AAA family ATPase [Streptomyces sp. NPDC088736]|uniref:AAA family ATPase n=1 Tax=Streptomyces sp. NPDC088736 TaxID=3365881 RepID=UPI00381D1533